MNSEQFSFLKRHPYYAFYCLCSYYPLRAEHLRKYRHVLLWDVVCENENIEWSNGLLHVFLNHFRDEHGKLNELLCYNEKLPWSVAFIEPFKKLWYWEALGQNARIKHDEIIQAVFRDMREPINKWLQSQTSIEVLNQNSETLWKERYKSEPWLLYTTVEQVDRDSEIDWNTLSHSEHLAWSGELIRRYQDKWNWQTLSTNRNIHWTVEMISEFEDRIFWGRLAKTKNKWGKERVTAEAGLTMFSNKLWSPEEVDRYKDRIDWHTLSTSEIAFRWNFDLMLKFEEHIDFDFLTWHRKAWTEGFGNLSDADVETILGDKEMQNEVSKLIKLGEKVAEDLENDWEEGTTKIPECLTYEYFLKTNSK